MTVQRTRVLGVWGLSVAALVAASYLVHAQQPPAAPASTMSFFITSRGSGDGANLGGLQGADRLCQTRATAVGAGGRTWHAYLSTQATGRASAVNARDRIGTGPWFNARGVRIATNLNELHSDANNLFKTTQLTEKGEIVNGRGDTPNRHDMLTGSPPDGNCSVSVKRRSSSA